MTVTREEARAYIREHAEDYLQKDGSKQGFICPICGSGSGNKGTGITTKDHIHFTCWAGGCFKNADIIDIIGLKYNCTTEAEKFKRAYEEFRIEPDTGKPKANTKPKAENKYTSNPIDKSKEDLKDYTAFFNKAHSAYKQTSYLRDRGISDAIADRFNIGFCKGFNYGGVQDDALIIPIGPHSYNIRFINQTDKGNRYRKRGEAGLFNPEALKSNKPIWVVEGEIDCMSILEAGGEAVGLGSTSGADLLTEYIHKHNLKPTLIIALDNDEAGIKTTEALKKGLYELNIKYIEKDLSWGSSTKVDANDILKESKARLEEIINDTNNDIKAMEAQEKAEAIADYKRNSAKSHLTAFLNGIQESVNTPYIPTGFKNLDEELDGGLFEGLYFIGAISSLGKTTFTLQIADQIAKSGHDVLIFSLEMARSELMAKSISRETLIQSNDINNARTTRGITTGKKYEGYTKAQLDLINTAIKSYSMYADNIYIIEGIGDVTASTIRNAVDKHIALTGNRPVVLIDYLQIIAPADIRATDKQNTDKAVMELKRISRDYKLSIIGISSFNRENYSTKVSMASFKESGAIEYSSDVLIGLQLKGQGEKDFNVDEAKGKSNSPENYRDIELVILKNRNGRTGGKAYYRYYAWFNYFKEVDG